MKKTALVLLISLYLFLQLNDNSYGQWKPQNSGLTTWIGSICFTDANTGYATSNKGKLLKTIDGGKNWFQLTTGVTKDLYCVYFVNSKIGYVSGDSGTIIKTTDGGDTWTPQESGITVFGIYHIYFLNTDTGYAVGSHIIPNGVILKTTDGGAHWIFQKELDVKQLNYVLFTDADNGIVLGGTADGRSYGYGIITRTTDGGNTWNTVDSLQSFLPWGICFTNKNTGYVVGWVENGGIILKTTDAGKTWIKKNTSKVDSLNQVFFTDENTGYAVGRFGTILKTYDAGENWIKQNSGTNKFIGAVYFTSKDTGYASGSAGTMLKTTNGGEPDPDIYYIQGKVTYHNKSNSAMSNVKLKLMNQNNEKIDSTLTDVNGNYMFSNLGNGDYTIMPETDIEPDGIDMIDALLANRIYLGVYNPDNFKRKAADVDASESVTPIDALQIKQYYLGYINSFKAGKWYFEPLNFSINSGNTTLNIKAICIGDVNGGFKPY